MKNRSRNNLTILLAFAVSLMALSITGDARGLGSSTECMDLGPSGCVASHEECVDCEKACSEKKKGCVADKWKYCAVDGELCPNGQVYWECACKDAFHSF